MRPQLWLNVLLAFIGMGVSAGALWLGWTVDTSQPALAASLGLANGLLGRALVAFHFLLAAQLSYVILWYRTRSRKDFRGQYKLWCWVGPTWMLLALASAIDGRSLIQELLVPQITGRVWHAETLCWMVPAAILVLTTTKFLLHDMWEDRWGTAFIVLSGCSALTAAIVVLAGPLLTIGLTTTQTLHQASVHTWSLAALLSMMFHARYVIHVTNEAPPLRQPGRIAGILRSLTPKLPRRRPIPDPGDATNEDAPEQPAAVRSKTADGNAPAAGNASDGVRRVEPAEAAGKRRPQPVARESSGSDPAAPLDESADSTGDDQQTTPPGLSKKQLRRLRKQRRQQERSQQSRL